jgi:hypothetical protein
MLKSILNPRNNFKFNRAENLGPENESTPKLIEIEIDGGEGITAIDLVDPFPFSATLIDIKRTEQIMGQFPSPETLAAEQDYLAEIRSKIANLKVRESEIEEIIRASLKPNLDKYLQKLDRERVENKRIPLDENQKNMERVYFTRIINEKLHEQEPTKTELKQIKQELSYLRNEEISGRFLEEMTNKEKEPYKLILESLFDSYEGSPDQLKDKRSKLESYVIHLAYPSTNTPKIETHLFYQAFILYGPKDGIEKIQAWKDSYIKRGDRAVEYYQYNYLIRVLKGNFGQNCEKYPILRESFKRIIGKLSPKELGLTQDNYSTLIEAAKTNIPNALKYLAEQNRNNYCAYNLNLMEYVDGRQEVRVDSLIEKSGDFQGAISEQVGINSIRIKNDDYERNLASWNIENGESIRKAAADYRQHFLQSNNFTQTTISELRSNNTTNPKSDDPWSQSNNS